MAVAIIAAVVVGGSYLAIREPSTDERVDAKFDVVGIHRVPSLGVRWARFSESDWFGEFSGTVVATIAPAEIDEFLHRSGADYRSIRLAVPQSFDRPVTDPALRAVTLRPGNGPFIDTPLQLPGLVMDHLPELAGRRFVELQPDMSGGNEWLVDLLCTGRFCGMVITMSVS